LAWISANGHRRLTSLKTIPEHTPL
jgi:hypothetical protein